MSKEDKVGGSSGMMPTVLTPVEMARTPGMAKVFILTPEILQKLGLAGHLTARISSGDVAKKVGAPSEQGSREIMDEKSLEPGKGTKEVVEQSGGSNKRKRQSTSTQKAEKTSTQKAEKTETQKSSISEQLEQRLNGTHEEVPADGIKSEESSCSTPKTKKRRRRSNAKEIRDFEPQNRNSEEDKESKDEAKTSTPGVRTSKRVIKVKKFEDYILTDDIPIYTDNDSAGKVRRRRSSANAKKTDVEAKISTKGLGEENSREKVESNEEEHSEIRIDDADPKQNNSEAKDRVSSQDIRFKVPETPTNLSKIEARKTYGKPKEKLGITKLAPRNELETTPKLIASQARHILSPAASQSTSNVGQKILQNEKPKEKSVTESIGLKVATNSREAVEALKRKISGTTSIVSSEKISFAVPQRLPNFNRRESPKVSESRKPKEKSLEKMVELGNARKGKEELEKTLSHNLLSRETSLAVSQTASNNDRTKVEESCESREGITLQVSELGEEKWRKESVEAVAFMQGNTEAERSLFIEEIGRDAPRTPSKASWKGEEKSTKEVEVVDFMQGRSEAERSLFGEESHFEESKKREVLKTYMKRKLKEKLVDQEEEKSRERIDEDTSKHGLSVAKESSFHENISATIRGTGYRRTYEKRKPKEISTEEKVAEEIRSKMGTEVTAEDQESSEAASDPFPGSIFSTKSLDTSSMQSPIAPLKIEESNVKMAETLRILSKNEENSISKPTNWTKNEESRVSKPKASRMLNKNERTSDSRKFLEAQRILWKEEEEIDGTMLNSLGHPGETGKAVDAESVPLLLPDKTEVRDTKSDSLKSVAKTEDVNCSKSESLSCMKEKEEYSKTKEATPSTSLDKNSEIADSILYSLIPIDGSEENACSKAAQRPRTPLHERKNACVSELESPMSPDGKEEVIVPVLESPMSPDGTEEVIVPVLESPMSPDGTEEVIVPVLESPMSPDGTEEVIVSVLESPMSPDGKEEVIVPVLESPMSPAGKEEVIVPVLESPMSPDENVEAFEACATDLESPMSPDELESPRPSEEKGDASCSKSLTNKIPSSTNNSSIFVDTQVDVTSEMEIKVKSIEIDLAKSSSNIGTILGKNEEAHRRSSKSLTNEFPSLAKHSSSSDKTLIPLVNETNCNVESVEISSPNICLKVVEVDNLIPAAFETAREPRAPRRRGRPKNPVILLDVEEHVEPDLQKEENSTIASSADASATTNNVSVNITCRTIKPVRMYADEVDGKGLSEESGDDESCEVKPAKRRGRPAGVISKGWTGGRRGKGRVRGGGKGKGPGRGQGNDSEYAPRIASAPGVRNDEEAGNTEEPKEKIPTVGEVECAKCKQQLTKKQWPRHNLTNHNGMGWLAGTKEPDFENDVKLLRSILSAALKKKRMLICETCETGKRSANGFISHLQFCGKTDEERLSLLVTCPICHNVMMPSSMEMHERTHRQVEKTVQEKKWEEAVDARDVSSSKGKRKAAEKAATKILEFTGLVKDDGEGQKLCSTRELNNMVQKPRCLNDPPNVWKTIWINELNTNGKAFCRQPLCQFSADSIDAIIEHNAVCPSTPRPMFVCKICNFSAECEEMVNSHVRDKHWDGGAKSGSGSDFEVTSSSSSGSESELEEVKPAMLKKEVDRYRPQSSGFKFLDIETPIHPKWPICYPPALRWTMKFELENYRLRLFEELSPNFMDLLEYEKSLEYLPELSRSMQVRLTEKHADKESGWIRWDRFQGSVNKGVPSLFTGGPVWALAWLPIPAPMYNLAVDQYVALSTHPTMESTYSIGSSYGGKNIIQIWNMGPLNHAKGAALRAPEFSYGIAHDKGTIWCMEWCPSGCYEHESFRDKSTKNPPDSRKRRRRMGLLATACSDGCVHIFSLPFPEDLEFVREENIPPDYRPIYQTKPVITLTVSASGYEKGEQNWQCTCINWGKSLGHDTIIAGFSNGYVALWDPTTTSPLLINSRDETTIIDAFHSFYAHGNAVSSVHLLTLGGKRFFYTTSYDRFTKLWDIEDLSAPVDTAKRGIVTAGSLFTNWAACVTAYDDAYGLANTHTYLMSLRLPGTKVVPMLPTKSTIYALGTSDFGNSIGQGTLAGEILVMFPHQLWSYKDMDRDIPKKRWLASTTQIVDFKANESSKKDSKRIRTGAKRKAMDKEYVYMPDTYEDCEDRFGIVFRDGLTRSRCDVRRSKHGLKPSCTDRLSTVNIEQYPFASVNRLSWNPNAWSYLWLCVGYQNGLVRFLNFNAVAVEQELRKSLPSHANSMLERARTLKANVAEDVNADIESETKSTS